MQKPKQKTKLFRICKQHIHDGLLKEAMHILTNSIKDDEEYLLLYIFLSQMMVKMQQNIGSFSHDIYIQYLLLNHPRLDYLKGGVKNE